jgi:hypothetical protein
MLVLASIAYDHVQLRYFVHQACSTSTAAVQCGTQDKLEAALLRIVICDHVL